jgi:hypothetical protein
VDHARVPGIRLPGGSDGLCLLGLGRHHRSGRALKKAGVSDAVILALIERDHTVFSIAPEQIVALQREAERDLIIAMLKSGQDADEAVRANRRTRTRSMAAAIAPGRRF